MAQAPDLHRSLSSGACLPWVGGFFLENGKAKKILNRRLSEQKKTMRTNIQIGSPSQEQLRAGVSWSLHVVDVGGDPQS